MSRPAGIGPIGTTARACIGVAITTVGVVRHGLDVWSAVGALTVLPTIAIGAAAAVNVGLRRLGPGTIGRAQSPWSPLQLGASTVVLAAVLGLGTVLTFLTPMNGVALYLFFGSSMVLAAARGYGGCEVLAVPNLLLRRRDAIWCPLYASFDGLDQSRAASR
ncbi:MAG: hypothetical protein M3313_03550 [Actinomycetota bacterium]|nr:hypothetical protein [Actinomycetota bacterium]